MGRRDHSISFLPLFVLAQPTSLMNPTGRNPPHLRHCSFRKLSAEIRIFVSAPNVAFCLHYAPFVFYSDQRLQTTIWSCIRDPGYRFLRFSWRFLFFFSTLFICVARIERSECKKYICKKKILEPKVYNLKFKICKIFKVTIFAKKNSRAKSLKFKICKIFRVTIDETLDFVDTL